jgi:molybdate transport system substrate-binding protein
MADFNVEATDVALAGTAGDGMVSRYNRLVIMHRVMRTVYLTLALAIVALTSCAKAPPNTVDANSENVLLSAAASTKEVMEELAGKFSSEGKVKINPGPSNGLATQILAGAPADLFLSASPQWADEIAKANLAAKSVRLLTNRLVLVVPNGNPAQVHEPKDLLSTSVKKIALAGEEVPAGKYADQALTKLGLLKQLVDAGKIARGQDVRTALNYVDGGEAEAGIVYSTDVGAGGGVEIVYEFDPSTHDEIVYMLVLLEGARDKAVAREFYEFLQSSDADAVYTKFGFSRIKSP